MIEFHFLGTAAGVPTPKRNVTALGIRFPQQRNWVLIDCGEGTQHQLMQSELTLSRLNTIFLTHLHGDHCYGLPGILASRSLQGSGEEQTLTVIGPPGTKRLVETIIELTELNLSYPLQLIEFSTENWQRQHWDFSGFSVEPVELSHSIPSFAYRFTEAPRPGRFDVAKAKADGIPPGPIYQQLQQGKAVTLDDGRRVSGNHYIAAPPKPRQFVIGGDNDKPECLKTSLVDCDLLVHEATMTEEMRAAIQGHVSHSTASGIAQIAEKARLPNLVLTHFSARFMDQQHALQSVIDEARQYFSGQLFLANDFVQLHLDREGKLTQHLPSYTAHK
ncbi:ribonuclease Z [Zooshikella ganghwensis]|uniref:Ribonuclease Z n=1 Tax=Zooshikella ganghwensis TaxID=202772 RepID=A0A4P9VMT3_9GAMM|nr:ribonuclease Z [Zooshikella ganghwensis]RDH44673.1 ribonuclease Z [Zooshikella ganghwensis]